MFSILIGILASALPNLLSFYLCKRVLGMAPSKFLNTLYVSEVLKFAGLALLFSICLQWPCLHVKHFILAFVCTEVLRAFLGVSLLARNLIK